MSFDKITDALEEAFGKAEASSGGGPLADGNYTAIVTRSLIYETDWNELQWELELSTPDGSVRKWHSLEDSDRFTYVKGDLEKLGFAGSLRDLGAKVGDFEGTVAHIKVVTKRGKERDFTNVYINNVVDPAEEMPAELAAVLAAKRAERGDGSSTAAVASPGASDDDIPFQPTAWLEV